MDLFDFPDTSTSGVVSDADERLSVSSQSTLDPQPLRLAMRRPKRPLGGRGGGGQQPQQREGKRAKRRQLNDSYLHSLATVTEICEEDVSGISCDQTTPLSLLFEEPERMLAWREFSELGDDEQLRFLGAAGDAYGEGEDPVDEELAAVLVPRAPTPAQRWRGLSAACRDFALRKALPGSHFHDQLLQFESQLRESFGSADAIGFGEAPSPADWIGDCRPACERLLLHAVAGYLGLTSASEDAQDRDGRRVRVRVPAGRNFLPPALPLSQFLQNLRLRRQRMLAAALALPSGW